MKPHVIENRLIKNRPDIQFYFFAPMAYPGIFFGGGGKGFQHIQLEDRENGDLGAVQEISFHIVKFS